MISFGKNKRSFYILGMAVMKLTFFVTDHVPWFRFAGQCVHDLKDLSFLHLSEGTGVGQEVTRGHSQDNGLKVNQSYLIHYDVILSNKIEEERRRKREHGSNFAFPNKQSHMMNPAFLETACWYKTVNEFLVLLCL